MEFANFPPRERGDLRFSSIEIAGLHSLLSDERRMGRIDAMAGVAGDTLGNTIDTLALGTDHQLEVIHGFGADLSGQLNLKGQEKGYFLGVFDNSAAQSLEKRFDRAGASNV